MVGGAGTGLHVGGEALAAALLDVLEELHVDAVGVVDPAGGVGAGDHGGAEGLCLLDSVDGHVAGAGDHHGLALEGVDEVDEAVTGGLGTAERAAEGEALAGEHTGELVADALVLAEEVADLAAAHADVAGGHVGVGTDVALELGHERLAEGHDLAVGLALGVEVRTALSTAHGERSQ